MGDVLIDAGWIAAYTLIISLTIQDSSMLCSSFSWGKSACSYGEGEYRACCRILDAGKLLSELTEWTVWMEEDWRCTKGIRELGEIITSQHRFACRLFPFSLKMNIKGKTPKIRPNTHGDSFAWHAPFGAARWPPRILRSIVQLFVSVGDVDKRPSWITDISRGFGLIWEAKACHAQRCKFFKKITRGTKAVQFKQCHDGAW